MIMLDNVLKQTGKEVAEKLAAVGVRDAGVYNDGFAEMLSNAAEASPDGKIRGIVAALNNSDTEGVLLQVLENNPEKVLLGLKIAAHAAETDSIVLKIPEFAQDVYNKVRGLFEENGVLVETGLVNRRACKGCVLMHIVCATEIVDALDGQPDGVYVSVNGAPVKRFPADTVLRTLVSDDGVKAVQTGYSLCSPDILKLTVREAKIENGVLKTVSDARCVVAAVEERLLASRRQSCGKCVFCREGLVQLEGMHRDIVQGRGKTDFIDITNEIGEAMIYSTPCSMGQKASEIAISAVKNFGAEYDEHIRRRRCRSDSCTAYRNIYIDPMTCSGCGECIKACPLNCIDGRPGYIHTVDDYDCTKCGKCVSACPEKSVVITTKRVPRLPQRVTRVGKFKRHF